LTYEREITFKKINNRSNGFEIEIGETEVNTLMKITGQSVCIVVPYDLLTTASHPRQQHDVTMDGRGGGLPV
jgi:hypothetical protein